MQDETFCVIVTADLAELCCSIQHLDKSAETSLLICSLIYGCSSFFTGTELQATLVVIIKASKNYTGFSVLVLSKKIDDVVTGDNLQAFSAVFFYFCAKKSAW